MNKNNQGLLATKMVRETIRGEIVIHWDAHYDLRSPGCSRSTLGESIAAADFQKGCPRIIRSWPVRKGKVCLGNHMQEDPGSKENLVYLRNWESVRMATNGTKLGMSRSG